MKPVRNSFCSNSPIKRKRLLPKWSMSSILPTPTCKLKKYDNAAKISERTTWHASSF